MIGATFREQRGANRPGETIPQRRTSADRQQLIENATRGFAIGRRNLLFFDQSDGAEASTSFYTIIETARANGIEPMHYLKFLFNCIERFGQYKMP